MNSDVPRQKTTADFGWSAVVLFYSDIRLDSSLEATSSGYDGNTVSSHISYLMTDIVEAVALTTSKRSSRLLISGYIYSYGHQTNDGHIMTVLVLDVIDTSKPTQFGYK
ncbi:unnamed protein product [Protopolystoma xenopodis]|uniref:Uncharacterized protein n=1 Tax=Protopolystoma xenopodis TaxID=117903 RepID=A0A3S5BIV0_9PLAT|nr:unnamed protein product [Protopolystoma xenopodis]